MIQVVSYSHACIRTRRNAVSHCTAAFITFSVLVANPKKVLYTVTSLARGLLNREKRTKENTTLFKKNLNASRLSEHPSVRGKKMSTRLGGLT